jgi:flagellar biosynthesis protein FlhA
LDQRLLRVGDIIVAVGIIGMVVMMVIPMPTILLDLLLSLNLTFALVVLLVSMYNPEPLGFSVFPALLLVATLFRLALNVSSTRLILLYGYAGEMIERFGDFVVGGNAVVGFIVFLILVVIQFIVITRGAERVAEVAARFTLDAMPGKQMSIDADLNAGLITESEARQRRRDIEREADFYGAMDGAAKFVKGDAIAGLIITAINLVGGFTIGVLQQGLPFEIALQKYSLLTVGDGLVTQIPALLISTATGMVVTRAASESNLGSELIKQVLGHPKVLWVASGLLFFLALTPGLPKLPFFLLSGLMATMALNLSRHVTENKHAGPVRVARDNPLAPENVRGLLEVDALGVELGYGLIPLADGGQGGDLLDRVVSIRRQLVVDLGIVVPPVRIRDNIGHLRPNEYVIKLRGLKVAGGEIFPDRYLAMNPGSASGELEGITTREPVFGLEAVWVTLDAREKAELGGYTVVDPSSVLATHLTEVIKGHAHELLGRQEVKTMVEAIRETHPAVVDELVPSALSIGDVQKVLQGLLQEGIPVRDLITILEALADGAVYSKNPEDLIDWVRVSLRRQITKVYELDEDRAQVITLDPDLEKRIAEGINAGASVLGLFRPEEIRAMLKSLSDLAERFTLHGRMPVVVCAPEIRRHFKALVHHYEPRIAVLSYRELLPGIKVEPVGIVTLR